MERVRGIGPLLQELLDASGPERRCSAQAARSLSSAEGGGLEPELRIVRRGSKTILIPVAEVERWLDKSAARYPI